MDDLEFKPATPARWDDLARVMASFHNSSQCWCAYWYLSNAGYGAGWGDGNRDAFERLVKSGAEPGLLAYSGSVPPPGSASRRVGILIGSIAAGTSRHSTTRMSGQ